jgi:hypothetical protein
MTLSGTQRLCEHLSTIVGFLEKGDAQGAASVVADMTNLLETLPPEMPEEEMAEARRLIERYAALSGALRQETLDSLNRLNAVSQSTAYGRRGFRP